VINFLIAESFKEFIYAYAQVRIPAVYEGMYIHVKL